MNVSTTLFRVGNKAMIAAVTVFLLIYYLYDNGRFPITHSTFIINKMWALFNTYTSLNKPSPGLFILAMGSISFIFLHKF
jgi:hypothetical protein